MYLVWVATSRTTTKTMVGGIAIQTVKDLTVIKVGRKAIGEMEINDMTTLTMKEKVVEELIY